MNIMASKRMVILLFGIFLLLIAVMLLMFNGYSSNSQATGLGPFGTNTIVQTYWLQTVTAQTK